MNIVMYLGQYFRRGRSIHFAGPEGVKWELGFAFFVHWEYWNLGQWNLESQTMRMKLGFVQKIG